MPAATDRPTIAPVLMPPPPPPLGPVDVGDVDEVVLEAVSEGLPVEVTVTIGTDVDEEIDEV